MRDSTMAGGEILEVGLDLPLESLPFRAGATVGHEEVGAIFMPEVSAVGVADAFPVLVRDDVSEGNAVLFHELGAEAGGAVEGAGAGVSGVFAHFDADGEAVPGAFVVGVLALFVCGESLINGVVINGKVPGEVAEGIMSGCQAAALEEAGMGASAGAGGGVLGGVDGDVAGFHFTHLAAAKFSGGNEGFGDGDLRRFFGLPWGGDGRRELKRRGGGGRSRGDGAELRGGGRGGGGGTGEENTDGERESGEEEG